jgi:GTP-binding protein HflX
LNAEINEPEGNNDEPMFSVSYDPLELPSPMTLERDLEDMLMERALRFYDKKLVRQYEKCYLVGLEDRSLLHNDHGYDSDDDNDHHVNKSNGTVTYFTLEESLAELSELAGAAGLEVVGSTYQRVAKPNLEYYIGVGKTKDIAKNMARHHCTCVIFDAELSPSQQKNLELAFNQDNSNRRDAKKQIKVIDRTALILDIFAQHARTKEGQLQVQLALMTYRLPRLTNMWTHLERQSGGARGQSSGGVGLRGPGEKQLESDRRQMKSKISILNRAIDSVRRHRSMHRTRRRRLGLPVVALVGYTNSGKSTLLNMLANAGVFVADMLFATLDPTTRLVRMRGLKNPDILLTDTVGFIQKLPTNLVAAFRATLEEISEADVLLHVCDVSNDAWRKQEAAVLKELSDMGLSDKPLVTVWNKIDLIPERKEFVKYEAAKRGNGAAISSLTGEGIDSLTKALEDALSSKMESIGTIISYDHATLLNSIYNLGVLDEVPYSLTHSLTYSLTHSLTHANFRWSIWMKVFTFVARSRCF